MVNGDDKDDEYDCRVLHASEVVVHFKGFLLYGQGCRKCDSFDFIEAFV